MLGEGYKSGGGDQNMDIVLLFDGFGLIGAPKCVCTVYDPAQNLEQGMICSGLGTLFGFCMGGPAGVQPVPACAKVCRNTVELSTLVVACCGG